MVARFLVALIGLSALAAGSHAQSALDLLRASLETRSSVRASMLQSQSLGPSSSERTMLKVEMDGQNRVRRTVLQPLRLQGQVILDDGRTLTIIAPDSKAVNQLPSPAARMTPIDLRMELIGRNYRVSRSRGETIAGRPTTLVTCRPVNRGMPTRRIWLDRETLVPLRIQSTVDSTTTLLLDTLSFEVPRSMPAELFEAQIPAGYSVVRISPPARVQTEQEADARLNFRSWIPRSVPMGFVAESVEVLASRPSGLLAIRLSDGFHSATLYQWDPRRLPDSMRRLDEEAIFSHRGLRMALLGDLPRSVMDRLREFFSKEGV